MPIVMRFVSFAQVTAFAFGPATDFSEGVDKPMKLSQKIVSLDINEYIPVVKPSDLFYPEVYAVLGVMCTFMFLVLTGAPERINSLKTRMMRTEGYDREHHNQIRCGFYHLVVHLMHFLRSVVGLVIGLCATVLVVPMFKICAKVLDCVHNDGDKPFLSADPYVICFESAHWKLVGAFGMIVPLYFALLLPYAIVEGDSQFVLKAHLFRPEKWRSHGITKATMVYQGPMHPRTQSIFAGRVVELLAKIALPVIVILTTSQPLLQTGGVCACGLSVFVVSLWYPPIVDPFMNSFIVGTQLFTMLCMFVGIVTVVSPVGKKFSVVLLLASLVVSLAEMCWQCTRAKGGLRSGWAKEGQRPQCRAKLPQSDEDM